MKKSTPYKIIISITLLLFVITIPARAQQSKPFELSVKLHPLAFINPERPSLQGDISLTFRSKVGLDVTYGQRYMELTPTLQNFDSLAINAHGYNLRLELKIYNINLLGFSNYKNTKEYLSVGYWIVNDYSNKKMEYYKNSTLNIDYYGLHKKMNVFAMNYGVTHSTNKWILEAQCGIGIRSGHYSWINSEYTETVHTPYGDTYSYELEGNKIFPHFNISIRIGYVII